MNYPTSSAGSVAKIAESAPSLKNVIGTLSESLDVLGAQIDDLNNKLRPIRDSNCLDNVKDSPSLSNKCPVPMPVPEHPQAIEALLRLYRTVSDLNNNVGAINQSLRVE